MTAARSVCLRIVLVLALIVPRAGAAQRSTVSFVRQPVRTADWPQSTDALRIAPDTVARKKPAGEAIVLGAVVGAAVGLFYLNAFCEGDQQCMRSEAPPRVVGGAAAGATFGFVLEVLFATPQPGGRGQYRVRLIRGAA